MIQPRPLTGPSAARAEESTAGARPGQVPHAARPPSRLCILSLSMVRTPSGDPDREASLAAMSRLAGLGFGVGLGLEPSERSALGWTTLAELIERAGRLTLARGFVAGASSEPVSGAASIADQLEGVTRQAGAIEEAGGVPLLLPLAALARRRASENEYIEVYHALLARMSGPVLIDWTGPRLRPELFDYFPGKSFERVMALDPTKVRGARFALLDVAREARLRRELLTRDQLLFTADREHLAHLLLGINPGPAQLSVHAPSRFTELAGLPLALGDFSHAMLAGATGDAEALSVALARLENGDAEGFVAGLPVR